MKTNLLIAASALAIAAAAPAFAQDTSTDNSSNSTSSTVSHDVKQGWNNTKQAVSDAADSTADATKKAYASIKAKMFGTTSSGSPSGQYVTFDTRTTAKGMIGSAIYNAANKKVGLVHDIILDPQGKVQMVIVSDGGILGLGSKYAAFDYGLVSQRLQDGDVIMPISDENIKKASVFSYDKADASKAGTRVIPEGDLSANTLVKAQLVDEKNQTQAQVNNITFDNGVATNLIVSINQTLGMGGESAAVPFNTVRPVQQDKNANNVDFQLDATQTAQFESFKKSMNGG